MPRYYCDVCDAYVQHDSFKGRKQHNYGYKHRDNYNAFFQQFLGSYVPPHRLPQPTPKTPKGMPPLAGIPTPEEAAAQLLAGPSSQPAAGPPAGIGPGPGFMPPPGGMPMPGPGPFPGAPPMHAAMPAMPPGMAPPPGMPLPPGFAPPPGAIPAPAAGSDAAGAPEDKDVVLGKPEE